MPCGGCAPLILCDCASIATNSNWDCFVCDFKLRVEALEDSSIDKGFDSKQRLTGSTRFDAQIRTNRHRHDERLRFDGTARVLRVRAQCRRATESEAGKSSGQQRRRLKSTFEKNSKLPRVHFLAPSLSQIE